MTTAYPEARQAGRALLGARRLGWTSVLSSLALLIVSVGFVDSRQLLTALGSVDTRWLAAAAVVSVLQLVLLGARYCHIGRAMGHRLTWVKASTEYALSILVNQVLPTGVLGDGLRAVRQARQSEQHQLGTALQAVALDRVVGYLVLVLVVLMTAPFGPGADLVGHGTLLSGVLLVAAMLGLSAPVITRTRLLRERLPWLRRLVMNAFRVLLTPKHFLVHVPLSLAFIGLLLMQLYVAARAVGVELALDQLLWLGPLVLLSMSVPSFFGGWGIREGVSALLFAAVGLDSATGVAVSVVYGAFTLIVSLPFVVVVLFDSQRGVSPRTSWRQAHSMCMLAGLGLALWSQFPQLLAFAAALSFLFLIVQSRSHWTPAGAFGLANWVTSLRLLLTLFLLGAHASISTSLFALGAVCVLLLDVIDGWLARRFGSASEFGAEYDVEVDTLLVAALALVLVVKGYSGLWVTLPLVLRYAYVLAPVFVRPRQLAASRTRLGRFAYVFMIVSFVVALVVPSSWALPLTASGTLAVSVSFVLSFWDRYART